MRTLLLSTHHFPVDVLQETFQKEAHFRLYNEFAKHGECVYTRYQDVGVKLDTSVNVAVSGFTIQDFDVFIPRTTTSHKHNIHNGFIAKILVTAFTKNGKRVLNGEHLVHFSPEFSKLTQIAFLLENGYPVPKTFTSPRNKLQKKFLDMVPLPYIAKPVTGSLGEGIFLVEQYEDLQNVPENYILQECLPDRMDYRVLVLGNKCLGAMKRTAASGKIVSNFSQGGTIEQVELTQDLRELALRVARLFRLEFCGVDLMRDNKGTLRVLEVNRFPSFVGFQKVTGIDVAQEVCSHIMQTTE